MKLSPSRLLMLRLERTRMDSSVPVASPDDLKAEVKSLISQMQSCCFSLRFSSWKCRCKILGCSLLLLSVLSVVIGWVCSSNTGAVTVAVSMLVFILVLCCLYQLPSSWSLVNDLRRLSSELKDVTAALKLRVNDEVWVRAWSSRWRSVEELERSGADIRGYVETMGSVVNTFLISELEKRLKESERLLRNI